jgi:hypothetical protein
MKRKSLLVFSFLALFNFVVQTISLAATYTVTNTNDSGAGSLRQAILNANANAGPDRIEFNIPGCTTVCTIQPVNFLPRLTDNQTTIDGYTQPGAIPASAFTGAILKIEIDGTNIPSGNDGLTILSAHNIIKGLVINRCPLNGISIAGPGATYNLISGNYIGTDPNGNEDRGNAFDGVYIGLGANNNGIGGLTPADRNILSANRWEGVAIHGSGSDNNVVMGNFIGTNADGTAALGNKYYGVRIYGGAMDNKVMATDFTNYNLISGNLVDGIRIFGPETTQNQVVGNAIGTNRTLTGAIPNGTSGVFIGGGAHHNSIGSTEIVMVNIISGNPNGILLDGGEETEKTRDNLIRANLIGLGSLPHTAIGNTDYGVLIKNGAHDNSLLQNWISGNKNGVAMGNPLGTGHPVEKNYIVENVIGLDQYGNKLANLSSGIILFSGSQTNYIGIAIASLANLISGNGDYGIRFVGNDILGNEVINSQIGLNEDGEPRPNGSMGILVEGTNIRNNIFSNLTIAHHSSSAIELRGDTVYNNVITRNSIYSNGEGINLVDGANGGIAKPVITSYSRTPAGAYLINGLACPGCTVELFSNRSNDPEGENFLRTTIAAAGGTFSFTVSPLDYPFLTATATDPVNGTSEFSDVLVIYWTYLPLILKN